MPHCTVYGCGNQIKNTKGSDISYYSFPTDPVLCQQWVEFCGHTSINYATARVCSQHFSDDSFIGDFRLRERLLGHKLRAVRTLSATAKPCIKEAENGASHNGTHLGQSTVVSACEVNGGDVSSSTSDWDSIDKSARYLELQKEHDQLVQKFESLDQRRRAIRTRLKHVYTSRQIRMLKSMKAQKKWTRAEMSAAVTVQKISPRAYAFLKRSLLYPLPPMCILRKWEAKFKLDNARCIRTPTCLKCQKYFNSKITKSGRLKRYTHWPAQKR